MADSLELIKLINIPLGIISIFGCLLIIITFIFFQNIRSFVLELVFYLALSCAMHTFSYIIYFPTKSTLSNDLGCQMQGFSMLFFGDSQFIWTSLISFSIFQSVIYLRDISTKNSTLRRYVYLMIGFGIPFLLSFVGFIFKIFGKSGFWCYIRRPDETVDPKDDFKLNFFLVFNYVLIWICVFMNLAFYTKVIIFIKKHLREEESEKIKRYTYLLIFYSVIQIICLLPATINRAYQLVSNSKLEVLDYIQSFFDCSQGLAYSIVYGLNPNVRDSIRSACSNFFRKRKSYSANSRKDSVESENSLKSNIDFTRLVIEKDDLIIT